MYSSTVQWLAYRSWHGVNRREELLTGGGEEVGDGGAEGWSAASLCRHLGSLHSTYPLETWTPAPTPLGWRWRPEATRRMVGQQRYNSAPPPKMRLETRLPAPGGGRPPLPPPPRPGWPWSEFNPFPIECGSGTQETEGVSVCDTCLGGALPLPGRDHSCVPTGSVGPAGGRKLSLC